MKNKNDLPRLPTSDEIFGKIVRASGIDAGFPNDRTARRLFNSGNLTEERRLEVYDAFAKAAVNSGIIPNLHTEMLGYPGKDDRQLSLALVLYAKMWDGISGCIRGIPTSGLENGSWKLPFFRLATIDLAIRLVSFLRLAGIAHLESEGPVWVEQYGYGNFLNDLRKKSGLTRQNLVERLDTVAENTMDSWLSGKTYPKDSDIEALAGILSRGELEGRQAEILVALRRNRVLFGLGELLVQEVGRENATDIVFHLVKYTNHALKGLKEASHLAPDVAAQANAALLIYGSQFPSATSLIGPWCKQETDSVWRADLEAVHGNWYGRLVLALKYLKSAPEAAKWAQEHLPVSEEKALRLAEQAVHLAQGTALVHPDKLQRGVAIRVHGDAKFSATNRMTQAIRSIAEGDNETALVHLRRAVELQPNNPDFRFELGAHLGKMGYVEDGIHECQVAAQLKSEWDLPKIEVGIILVNNSRYAEGRMVLEEVAKQVSMSAHLAFSLGYARMKCDAYSEALELFEVVLNEMPEHAQALDCAAHCSFISGRTDKGIALAKEAHKRGVDDTFQDWRDGKYKKH